MDEVEWWEFDTPAEMAEQVAGDIGFVIESATEGHAGARLALPGGRTPDLIYQQLLKNPALDWSKVTLLPTDDRLVPLADEASNYRKLNRLFAPKGADVISLVDEAALGDRREAGRLADARLQLLHWPLDLVCLGIGADGHTASIYPGPDFDAAVNGPKGRRAVGIRPEPLPKEAPYERVTLTAAAISSARTVMIVIMGDEKRRILEQAIKEGPLSSMAIGRVIADLDAAIDIFWSPEG